MLLTFVLEVPLEIIATHKKLNAALLGFRVVLIEICVQFRDTIVTGPKT